MQTSVSSGSARSCSLATVAAGLKLYRQRPSVDQAEIHVVTTLPGEKLQL